MNKDEIIIELENIIAEVKEEILIKEEILDSIKKR